MKKIFKKNEVYIFLLWAALLVTDINFNQYEDRYWSIIIDVLGLTCSGLILILGFMLYLFNKRKK